MYRKHSGFVHGFMSSRSIMVFFLGSFGKVFKGKYLNSDTYSEVAIKTLKSKFPY